MNEFAPSTTTNACLTHDRQYVHIIQSFHRPPEQYSRHHHYIYLHVATNLMPLCSFIVIPSSSSHSSTLFTYYYLQSSPPMYTNITDSHHPDPSQNLCPSYLHNKLLLYSTYVIYIYILSQFIQFHTTYILSSLIKIVIILCSTPLSTPFSLLLHYNFSMSMSMSMS